MSNLVVVDFVGKKIMGCPSPDTYSLKNFYKNVEPNVFTTKAKPFHQTIQKHNKKYVYKQINK